MKFLNPTDNTITRYICVHTVLLRAAQNECVALHAVWTTAHWYVIVDVTYGVLSARTRTRIDTFISHARFISWTIVVQHALRPAASVRISLVFF